MTVISDSRNARFRAAEVRKPPWSGRHAMSPIRMEMWATPAAYVRLGGDNFWR